MSRQSPKLEVFAQFALVAKALSSSHRLELLELLAQGERSVERLAEISKLKIGNTSQHLQHLRRAGLVESRRNGKFVLYRLRDESVLSLLAALRNIAERNLAEVNKVIADYFNERDAMEPVSRQDLMKRMRKGSVTVLDVRPADEFAAGHLPGAINVTLKDLSAKLAELPADKEIIAYCRGHYCVFSFEAVAALRAEGFEARRLEDGFPEWKAAKLPTESAANAA